MELADRGQSSLGRRLQSAFSRHAVLFKNSAALTIGSGFTSVLGFAYWWIAARTFSPDVLGTASALISLIGVVCVVGDAGLTSLTVGEIVLWPQRKEGFIAAAMVTCIFSCVLVGVLTLPLSTFVMSASSGVIDNLIVLIACGLTAISMITDQAFVGMLQSTLRMLRQFSWSSFRLILLVTLSIWFSAELVVLISWFGSLALSLLIGEALMRRRGQSFVHKPDFELLWSLKNRAVGHYMLDLGLMVPAMAMPYLVTVLVSASSNAAFTMIWLVIGVGSLVPSALATVLFPVLRAEPDQYRQKMRLSLFLSLVFAVGFAFILWSASSLFLVLFNPLYLQVPGSDYLGILGFGLIGAVVRFHVAAAARVGNRMRQMSRWVFLAALFEVAAAAVGSLFAGLAGLCIGWTIATAVEGMAMWAFANPCVPPADAGDFSPCRVG